MAGTYWLTVLPDTSKLKPAIEAAMRGQKIKADFGVDEAKAKKAGRDAAQIAETEANKTKPKVKPEADIPASKRAGEQVADEADSAIKKKRPKVRPEPDMPGARKAGEDAGGSAATGIASSLKRLAPMLGGLSILGGLKSSLSEGMDFTSALNMMGGVTKATGDQLQQVSAIARQLGSDVSLPGVSATTAAQAMTELAKGGFSVQQSMDAARGTLQLAGAAGIDAATAATIQADALHAFGLTAKDAGYAADVLANVANASTGEITDFAAGFQQAGAVASQFGLTIDDTAAALGTLANQGIKGSDAGTLIKSSLLAITDQGKPAQGAIKELGLTLYNAEGQFVGMRSMMDQLGQAAKRMSPEMYQAATNTLFGSDAARLAGVAAKEGAAGFDTLKEAVNKQGGAADMAAARTQGLPGAWANFQNTLDNVKLSIYDMIQGPLTGLLNKLSSIPDFVTRNADAFKIAAGVITTLLVPALVAWSVAQARALATSIVGAVTGLIGSWTAMAGAISSAAAAAATYAITIARGVAASIVSGLTAMVAAFRNLSIGTRIAAAAQAAFNIVMTANPIGLIVTAIAAVVAGLVYFFTQTELGQKIWKGFTEYLKIAWEAIKIAFKVAWDFIGGIWDSMVSGAGMVWNGIKEKFTAVVDFVKGLPGMIGNAAKGMWDGITNAFRSMIDGLKRMWNGLADKLSFTTPTWLPGDLGGKTFSLPKFASGGRVYGPGSGRSDSILGYPAMVAVSNGEYVINAKSAAKYLPLLNALNAGAIPGFANGGLTPHATEMKSVISRMFGISNIGGYREPDGYNEHSTGNALDVMIPNSDTEQGKALGDAITAWALKNAKAIGLTGAIWRQTSYGYGNGFDGTGKSMPDRGNPTANHFDHVHLFMNDAPDKSLSLSSAQSVSSSIGSATSAGGSSYRAATSAELSSASGRVDSANKAVTQAQQRVDDRTFNRDQAQKRLDAARAAGKDTTQAEEMLRRADRELADANINLAEKRDKAAEAEQAYTDLQTNGKLVPNKSGSDSTSAGSSSEPGKDFGQMFVSGLMESIGLDGSLFSNPMEWPTIKSAMAGVNWLGKLFSGQGSDATAVADTSASGGGTVGGFASGAADAVGLGGLLSAIPKPSQFTSGSPALAPGEFNPAVAGGTAVAAAPGMSAFAPPPNPAAAGQNAPQVDNSINFQGPVGMAPADIENKVTSMQTARTRTTMVKG